MKKKKGRKKHILKVPEYQGKTLASIPTEFHKVEKCPEGGYLTYFKGQKYPVHGFPTDEKLWVTEMFKKYISSYMRLLTGKPQKYFLVLIFPILKPLVLQWIKQFARYSEGVVLQYIKPEEFSPAVQEVYRVLMEIWGGTQDADNAILGLCFILEHDKAYRWHLQDILMAANKTMLINGTVKEVTRLVNLYATRELREKVYKDMGLVIIPLMWLLPMLRKAVKRFAEEADFKKFQFDRYDLHACLREKNYDYDNSNIGRYSIIKTIFNMVF